ncbi:adenosine kinase [Candidatus Woesearchaeota archaeon]|nr:adenosine kinase [Candidatus Woesearchaeota archaeon]
MHKHDVYGIGNSIVDILVNVEEQLLEELNLPKGIMSLVDVERSKKLLGSVRLHGKTVMPGGSCCNTMIGVANLGGRAGYAGVVGDDIYGKIFAEKLPLFGVKSNLTRVAGMTGSSVILVTPDGERTMNTHLGVCTQLVKQHIIEDEILKSKIFHTTAYALDTAPEAVMHALELAKRNNITISFDVSDPFLVRDKNVLMKEIVKKYADIVFLNKEEARLFTGHQPYEALGVIAKNGSTVALKIGSEGSLVLHNGKLYRISALKVNALDTTGAGDAYAAGLLFGLTNGYSMSDACRIASFSAGKVVEVMGARVGNSLKEDVIKMCG